MSGTEIINRDEFFESLLGDFLDESGQLLDRLNENLLQLDDWVRELDDDHRQRCDEDLMNEMFRSAHSLKGLSAMLGLSDVNDLTHKVENVFDAARKDELIITGDCVELMFQAVDRLVGMVEALKEPDGGNVDCQDVLAGIGTLLQEAGVERKKSSQADAEKALADLESEVAASGATPALCEASSEPEEIKSAEDPFAGIANEEEFSTKYLGIFIDETEMSLDALTETLLALEGGGNRESLETLLVTSHRIKGSAASIGLNRTAKLAHLMEDQLQLLVDSGETLSPELTDAMLRATDGLRSFLESLKQGTAEEDSFSQLASGLMAARNAPPAPSEPVGNRESEVESAEPAAPPSGKLEIAEDLRQKAWADAPAGTKGFVGCLRFQAELPLVGLKAQLIHEKLSNLGEVFYFTPAVETLEELETIDLVGFGVVTEHEQGHLERQLNVAGVRELVFEGPPSGESAEAEPRLKEQTTKASASPAQAAKANGTATETAVSGQRKNIASDADNRPSETLRVDVDRLDQLMNLAGQLVISRARLAQIDGSLKASVGTKQSAQAIKSVFGMLDKIANASGGSNAGKSHLQAELDTVRGQARRIQAELEPMRRDVDALQDVRLSVDELGEAIHQLGRISDGIQQSVMGTRMVPIGPLFTRFKRVVRDITRANGKTVRLIINGEKTELDKRMIDELGDPLIHTVRNSVDHGIELPEQREAQGKPREGTVTLDAFHRGNSIYIEVTDDGKGLDPDRILCKALEKGVVTRADAEKMTSHQIYQLVWEPGLSTAEKVTEVSGRGMGMDIVKSKIEEINGTVDLDSTPGEGTKLTIKLPLTLAILPSLMVEIDGDVFAMPMESIIEIVRISRKDLTTVQGLRIARVRGRAISMVYLDEVLSWNRSLAMKRAEDDVETTLVVVGEPGHEIGLPVDQVLGEEDVVIKSMAENYQNVAGIAGASILGDGRVSLILDTNALIEMSSSQAVNA